MFVFLLKNKQANNWNDVDPWVVVMIPPWVKLFLHVPETGQGVIKDLKKVFQRLCLQQLWLKGSSVSPHLLPELSIHSQFSAPSVTHNTYWYLWEVTYSSWTSQRWFGKRRRKRGGRRAGRPDRKKEKKKKSKRQYDKWKAEGERPKTLALLELGGTSQSHLLPWGDGSFSNEVTPNPLPNLPTSDFKMPACSLSSFSNAYIWAALPKRPLCLWKIIYSCR